MTSEIEVKLEYKIEGTMKSKTEVKFKYKYEGQMKPTTEVKWEALTGREAEENNPNPRTPIDSRTVPRPEGPVSTTIA